MVKNQSTNQIAENVFVLQDEVFPLYLVRSKNNILVDCSILAKVENIEVQIKEILGESKINIVLLTHSHYDHTGSCYYLQQHHPFSIYSSKRTKEILENSKSVSFINRLNQEFMKMMRDNKPKHFQTPQFMIAVREGDMISISESEHIQVYETPGHTRCSISFLLQPQGVLFVGDAAGVMEKNRKIKPLFLSSYRQYEESLKKILSLNADILALPHNTYIAGKKNVKEFLNASLNETRLFKEELLGALKSSTNPEKIAADILAREFPLPTVAGPREALMINLIAMVNAVKREFRNKEN